MFARLTIYVFMYLPMQGPNLGLRTGFLGFAEIIWMYELGPYFPYLPVFTCSRKELDFENLSTRSMQ